jgi:predicted O-methyltransferase YrrM
MNSIEAVIEAAMQIQGWRKDEECAEIARAALDLPDNPTIVEVGVYMGRSSAVLAGALKLSGRGGTLHCIDPFDCSGDAFSTPHYRRILEESGSKSLEDVFRHNIKKLGLDDAIEVHAKNAEDVAATWSTAIDLILLDGDQSVEGARRAFDDWAPFLKEGGTLVVGNSPVGQKTPGHNGNRLIVETLLLPPHYINLRQYGSTVIATKGPLG